MKIINDFDGETNRYAFDNELLPKGFLQVDTEQDASYYGNWAHLDELKLVTFAEGDIRRIEFDTPEAFAAHLRRTYQLIHIDMGIDQRPHWQARAAELGISDICA